MDGRTDPLNSWGPPSGGPDDPALDKDIEALLSVEPSPDFVARLRSHVADQSMSSAWGWRWPIALVATAIAAVVVGVALWRPAERATQTTSAAPPRVAAQVDSHHPVITRSLEQPVAARARREPERAVAAPSRGVEIALPPVIIAENETRAFAVLVRTAPSTQFDFTPPTTPSAAPLEVEKMPTIDLVTVDPLVIKPLVTE
jgi:hypothetical protein